MQTLTLELPEETFKRLEHSAAMARKPLSEFVTARLVETLAPVTADLPTAQQNDLEALDRLDTEALQRVAHSQLSADAQRRYTELLQSQGATNLTRTEQTELQTLGDAARRLTLRRAHAYMLLKWRGVTVSMPELDLDSE